MATVPKSFITNFVQNARQANPGGQNNNAGTNTNVPPAGNNSQQNQGPTGSNVPKGTRAKKVPSPRPARPRVNRPKVQRPKKKVHGFFRRMAGAVAAQALKGTGHLGKHVVHSIHEDGGAAAGGSGGIPVNNASSGAVAGLGTGKDEPGVKKRKKNPPIMSYQLFKRTRNI